MNALYQLFLSYHTDDERRGRGWGSYTRRKYWWKKVSPSVLYLSPAGIANSLILRSQSTFSPENFRHMWNARRVSLHVEEEEEEEEGRPCMPVKKEWRNLAKNISLLLLCVSLSFSCIKSQDFDRPYVAPRFEWPRTKKYCQLPLPLRQKRIGQLFPYFSGSKLLQKNWPLFFLCWHFIFSTPLFFLAEKRGELRQLLPFFTGNPILHLASPPREA